MYCAPDVAALYTVPDAGSTVHVEGTMPRMPPWASPGLAGPAAQTCPATSTNDMGQPSSCQPDLPHRVPAPGQQDPRALATPVVLRASDAQPTRREASHGAATPQAQTRLATSASELRAGPRTAGTRGHAPPQCTERYTHRTVQQAQRAAGDAGPKLDWTANATRIGAFYRAS